jgi:nucleotide-binding universal stress UspA family protein
MSIKTILVLNDGGGSREATVGTAVACARAFSAHLDVLHVRPDPETMVPVVGEAMTGAMVEQMMEAMARTVEERAAKARAAFDRLCQPSGLSVAWHETTGREPDLLAGSGRVSDLIVIGRPNGDGDGPMAATLDAALFDTGRPVLVAPPKAAATAGDRVAVAWNGSAQSARIVAAALPFLKRASEVVILSGGEDDKRAPAAQLLSNLSRHGVKARHENFPHVSEAQLGKALLEQAARLSAGMLVMGAYGHSRLREMILGGATRDVLATAEIPVLMGH